MPIQDGNQGKSSETGKLALENDGLSEEYIG